MDRPEPPDAVVLLRDDDNQKERRDGLEQARKESNVDVPIVIGLAHTKRECWVLAGFEPRSVEEEQHLAAVRKQIGFDPTAHAERLAAKHDSDTHSAKRILGVLTEGDKDRETQCWQITELDTLKTRGENSGLKSYLVEVEETLVPRLTKKNKQ